MLHGKQIYKLYQIERRTSDEKTSFLQSLFIGELCGKYGSVGVMSGKFTGGLCVFGTNLERRQMTYAGNV